MRRYAPLLLLTACGGVTEHDDPTARHRTVRIDASEVVATVDERFLSFALDTAQVVGGLWWSASAQQEGSLGEERQTPYDFDRERLQRLTAALSPAYLRIGGSEADRVYYDLTETATAPPAGYEELFTKSHVDAVGAFATRHDLDILFTLNAGPGPRDDSLEWNPAQMRAIVAYAESQNLPVDVWELGNEINAYQVIHGIDFRISPQRYADDIRAARAVLDELAPDKKLAGPSSAYWPEVGELAPLYADFMAEAGDVLDVITWHYYPQQSRRCPLAVREADPALMHTPSALDELATWADEVEASRDAHAPDVPVWLGETGNAQCGGEPGLSDAFVGGFWWLDQLGQLARRGQPVVVRQTLSGSNYGLLTEPALEPNPDYFSSVLWKRTMGTRALDAKVLSDLRLRVYAHCARGHGSGAVAVVALNLDEERGAFFTLEGIEGSKIFAYRLSAPSDASREIHLDGVPLRVSADGALPALDPVEETTDADAPELYVPASSYAFFVLPDADAPACR
ncbi:MAG: hypothetical protein RIT81_11625 [Deltaproteobacteria bacterium]